MTLTRFAVSRYSIYSLSDDEGQPLLTGQWYRGVMLGCIGRSPSLYRVLMRIIILSVCNIQGEVEGFVESRACPIFEKEEEKEENLSVSS